MELPNLTIISAGAGSGKTYRLTQEMIELLKSGVRPEGIIATTFTQKAATELQQRVRVGLINQGMALQADQLSNALIGTVHSLGVKLLQRFAYQAGVSPQVSIIADQDQNIFFNQALSTVLTANEINKMDNLASSLGFFTLRINKDWRKDLKAIVEIARVNAFDHQTLEASKTYSIQSYTALFDNASSISEKEWMDSLIQHIRTFIKTIETENDTTQKTATVVTILNKIIQQYHISKEFPAWHIWAKMSKIDTGAKSREAATQLKEFAASHLSNKKFHSDISEYIGRLFDLAKKAISEYDNFKKLRGLIDYTDMEVLINQLLENHTIKQVLSDEIDLLMVDEFQDTSPLQLEIFWKLSKIANQSIWVGDPKQSIYGFRGAEPRLMHSIIKKFGGIKKENIQRYSWRSRPDLVLASNAIFSSAFDDLPSDQIVLSPKRSNLAFETIQNSYDGHSLTALQHWSFDDDTGNKKMPRAPWFEASIARAVNTMLEREVLVFDKSSSQLRPVRPGDVAILCRTNKICETITQEINQVGLKAAISTNGLMETKEVRLIISALRFILNKRDTLSIAELLVLTDSMTLSELVNDRMDYLRSKNKSKTEEWGENEKIIDLLNSIRENGKEYSVTEMLNFLLHQTSLEKYIVLWGEVDQRLANIDQLMFYAKQYEDHTNRLQSSASLGGFLLWLGKLNQNGIDSKGANESDDTIRVMTYHKSKGLEFPIVLLHGLDGNLRHTVYNPSLVSIVDEIDLNNILANRLIRFWVNPYAAQEKNTILSHRIEETNTFIELRNTSLQEEARLLYVGITRARDYLIFATPRNQSKWVNRVVHNGEESIPALDPNMDVGQFVYRDYIIPIYSEIFINPRNFGRIEFKPEVVRLLENSINSTKKYDKYHIDDKDVNFDTLAPVKIIESIQITSKMFDDSWVEFDEIGNLVELVASYIHASSNNHNYSLKIKLAQSCIYYADMDIETVFKLSERDIVKFVDDVWHMYEYLIDTTSIKLHRHVSLVTIYEGRQWNGMVDFVIDDGSNRLFGGKFIKDIGPLTIEEIIENNRGWMVLVRNALKDWNGRREKVEFLFFQLWSGFLYRVELL